MTSKGAQDRGDCPDPVLYEAGRKPGPRSKLRKEHQVIRRLKNLGVSAGTVLVLSAMVASTAQATFPFTAPEGVVDLPGSPVTQLVFSSAGGLVSCTAQFIGTNTAASAQQQTLQPHFLTDCTGFGFQTHVNATPCTFQFSTPTVKIKAGEYTGASPKINCSAGDITITPTFFGASICTLTIGTQTPTAGHIVYKNEGAGTTRDILLTFNIEGIHYTSTGGVCGEADKTHIDGKLTGSVTLKGFKHNLTHTTANHRAVLVE